MRKKINSKTNKAQRIFSDVLYIIVINIYSLWKKMSSRYYCELREDVL